MNNDSFQYISSTSSFNSPFIYDLVDITRQQHQDLFAYLLPLYRNYTELDCYPYQNEYKTCPDNGFYSIMDSPTCQDEQGQVRPCTLNELKEICNSSPYCIAIGSSNTLYRRNGIHSQRINI